MVTTKLICETLEQIWKICLNVFNKSLCLKCGKETKKLSNFVITNLKNLNCEKKVVGRNRTNKVGGDLNRIFDWSLVSHCLLRQI